MHYLAENNLIGVINIFCGSKREELPTAQGKGRLRIPILTLPKACKTPESVMIALDLNHFHVIP